jgi:ligand-binding sensor domain-containing protein
LKSTAIVILIFLRLISGDCPLIAQIRPVIHFTEDDGLPGNIVRDIIKDNNGILWIATDNGVAKFDGDKFIPINSITGSPMSLARALSCGKENEIYAGLYKGGLAIIRNDTVKKIIHIDGRNPDAIRKLYYSDFYEKLFVGTDYGIFILNDSVLSPVNYYTYGTNPVVLSISGQDSLVFFSVMDKGVYKLNVNTEDPEKSSAMWISRYGGYSCLINGDTLYTASFNNIFRFYAKEQWEQRHVSEIDSTMFIWNLAAYKDGKLWVGGFGEGRFRGDIVLFNPEKDRSAPLAIKENIQSVNAIFYDTVSKVTWFGRDNGLTAVIESPFQFIDVNRNGTILDIGFAGDSLLILTEKGVYYAREGKLVPVLSKDQIMRKINYWCWKNDADPLKRHHIVLDHIFYTELVSFEQIDQRLFVSTQRGAISVPDMKTYLPFAAGTFMLVNDNSAYSSVKYDPLRFYPSIKDSLGWIIPEGPGGIAKDISKIIDSKGIFYCISGNGGLYALKNNTVYKLSENNSAIDNFLTDIDKDTEGNIWCSSVSGNLYEIVFTDSLFIKRKVDLIKSGLSGSSCKWIKFNRDCLLIGTNKGLNVLRQKTLYSDRPAIEHFYNSSNGFDFISSESPISDKDGNVYVHTSHEVITIDTNFVSYTGAKMYVSNVKVNGRDIDLIQIEHRNLPYNTKQISFLFNFIKYPLSRNISYRYKVNNGDWLQGNQVVLQSLRPDSYEISMEGINREDMTVITRKVSFKVNPPFWSSVWFILFSSILLLFTFYLFMRIRISRLKKQHEEKTRLIIRNSELQLRSLQIQMNPHFIFNTLNSIQTFILKKDTEESLRYLGKLASIIRTNLENASEEYINLSIEIEFLKKYIEIEKLRFKNDIHFEVLNNIIDFNIMLPPMLIQPLIENAIKHGIKNRDGLGKIKVEFHLKADVISVIVEDNGGGREFTQKSKTIKHNSKGLQIIEHRLNLLNELNHTKIHKITFIDLHDESIPLGTRVVLSLLLKRSV